MTDESPGDQAARDLIETSFDRTVFVDAGAGSGKTRELVQRMVNLVADRGVPIGNVAAITFTEAAASELRGRIRFELEKRCKRAKTDELEIALNDIDSAPIQTLHAFAQRILALHPFEAGLPAGFEVLDEIAGGLAFQREWLRFRDRIFDDGCGDPAVAKAVRWGLLLGLNEPDLFDLARAMHALWHRLEGSPGIEPLPALDVRAILGPIDDALALHTGGTADAALAKLAESQDWREDLAAAAAEAASAPTTAVREGAEDRVVRLLRNDVKLSTGNLGRPENWGGPEGKSELRQLTAEAQQAADQLRANLRRAILTRLLGPVRAFVLEYARRRREDGRLEFQDLLVLARDLLRANPDIARKVASRYRYLFIDEFQDTDPLQVEIATLIAGSRTGSRTAWNEIPVEPGRLFFVGDPKQSIYRFRNADIDLYLAARTRFGEILGQAVSLTENYRSSPPIITFANEVFSRIFSGARAQHPWPVVQVPFAGLVAHRATARGSVRVFGGPVELSADELREAEAHDLAAAIEELVANVTPIAVDDRERPTRYRDVTILIPTRTALPAIEQALSKRGIPARIEARSLLFATQEVRDLLNILRAIDDPSDQVAVVAALRTPGLGCSDRDLFEWRHAPWERERDGVVRTERIRSWDYTYGAQLKAECPAPALPVQWAMRKLAELHELRWWLDPGEVVDRVVRDLRLMELGFASTRPRDWWQRLRFVHEYARGFTDAGGSGLREFISWMEDQEESSAQALETVVSEPDDDAVRIMTIHAAKGLEFPIVCVAGLGSKRMVRSPVLLWPPTGGSFEARAGAQARGGYFRTSGHEALARYDAGMERLEDDRLLYVAVTRARDHLLISGYHAAVKDHDARHLNYACTLAECLWHTMQECPSTWEPMEIEPSPPSPPAPPSPDGPLPTLEAFEEWKTERTAMLATGMRLPATSATALEPPHQPPAPFAPDEAEAPDDEPDDPWESAAPTWRRGRGGTSLGRAVHAVLQTISLADATDQQVEAAARAQAEAESIATDWRDVARFVRIALQSPAVRKAAAANHWREVPVGVPLPGGGVLEGFIDLLYESPDGLVIVDYKTDVVRSEAEAAEKLAHYRLQGGAYAYALRRAVGREVARVVFLFLTEGGPRERELPNLEGAMADALVRATEVIAAGSAASA